MDKKYVANLADPPNSAADQLINAGILAGLGFFGNLLGLGATGLTQDPKTALMAAGIAAGFEFFLALAIQRGLKKAEGE